MNRPYVVAYGQDELGMAMLLAEIWSRWSFSCGPRFLTYTVLRCTKTSTGSHGQKIDSYVYETA